MKIESKHTSRHRIVAWGIPKALTGSPGMEQRSITTLGSSHLLSSSEAFAKGSVEEPLTLGDGASLIQGLLGGFGGSCMRVPTMASRAINLS